MLITKLADLREKYERLSTENLTLSENMSEVSQNRDNRTDEISRISG